MTFAEIARTAQALYQPILILEDVFPFERRRSVASVTTLALVIIFALLLGTAFLEYVPRVQPFTTLSFLDSLPWERIERVLAGLGLLLLSLRVSLLMLEAFHRSYYFRGMTCVIEETPCERVTPVSFEVAAIIHYTVPSDITAGFLRTPYGEDALERVGITREHIAQFVESERVPLLPDRFVAEVSSSVTLVSYAEIIYDNDAAFSSFLFSRGIRKEHFIGAVLWVMADHYALRRRERWYSRDRLGRIEGAGKDLAFGETYLLEKYGWFMKDDPLYSGIDASRVDEDTDVDRLEAELVRTRQSNVILIGEEGAGKREVLAELEHRIHEGLALPAIEFKHVFLFDVGALIASSREKAAFEDMLSQILLQAHDAGNIIMVIENYPAAVASASAFGSDLTALLMPHFEDTEVQFIITTDERLFHKSIESDGRLMQHFEPVRVHGVTTGGLIRLLQHRAVRLEKHYPVTMTYQGIVRIAEGATRYFPDAVLPDKGLDLLEEVFVYGSLHVGPLLGEAEVDAVIQEKTGIPLGAVRPDEQEMLAGLEAALASRVVGQPNAIKAVAGALRRSRAGINNPNRPIGTFLFLGPTGVGKTETAKALAHAFFHSDDAMHRLDMSEYQTSDAIERLIGFSDGTPGRLSNMLREAPYHVVLLDEFEKANSDVHDLFLQILDEGRFSDATGRLVNARNTIIIATSNAGADLIAKAQREGKALESVADDIVDELIRRGTFRPELLNRFDEVVFFHGLVESEVQKIARIELSKLAERVHNQGYTLVVTEELVARIAELGYDPRFGGRNINRVIKETAEQAIADVIINGQLQKGGSITLRSEDIDRYHELHTHVS